MKIFNYNNHIIVKCPVCGKVVENDDLEKGEVNGVNACKHLIFAQDNGGGSENCLFFTNGEFAHLLEKDETFNNRDITFLNMNPRFIVHRYDSYDSETHFVFKIPRKYNKHLAKQLAV